MIFFLLPSNGVGLFNPNSLGVVVIGVIGYEGNRVQVWVENEAESSVCRQVGVLSPTGSLWFKGLQYPNLSS